ncbi:calcium-binding protein [Cyanobium sp. Cruz CV13-4-11]|uniref:calcium-binding protein n=1 Tax=Cyanobium sp. Cruz CV13-4-11 TaxID=2823710 RepID=UPI0028F44A77|nr:calcium-binding protein [Cyanobium sp. Cruz CV13-4-11]
MPKASRYNGYTIQGTSSVLANSAKLVNTRIYQQNVDSAFAPGIVKNLTLNYTSSGAADNGALLSVSSTAARSITLENVLITGVHRGWNGNGNLYMSLRSFNAAAPLNTSLTLTGVRANLTGQGGFLGTTGGSAFLHSWNNNGPVTISSSTFDEAGYASSFNFLTFGSTVAGNYTLTGNTFFRSSNDTVRPEGNRLGSVVANLTDNIFQDGSYLDLYGNVGSVTLHDNTFATIAGGYGIRVNDPVLGTPTLSGTNVFTGAGLALKFVKATAGSTSLAGAVTVNGSSFSNLIAGGQAADTITGTAANDWISGDDGADSISGLAGDDFILGGAGNDTLIGGLGADMLTGGSGNDQFQWATGDGTDTITDFSTTEDQIALIDIFNNTSPGSTLAAADYATVVDNTFITIADSNKVIERTQGVSTLEFTSFTLAGLTNAYLLGYNSTVSNAQLYFDNDWGDTAGRQLVANFTNLTSGPLTNAFTNSNFIAV